MNPASSIPRLPRHEIVRSGPSAEVPGGRAAGDGAVGATKPWTEWLRPQEVALDVDVANSHLALANAADRIARTHSLDPAPILRALLRREQVGSTALGHGVAIPHARIEGLHRPLTLFMRTRRAISFGAPDGKPVSNLLIIMVPADGATDDHLQLLALIATTFSNRDFQRSLDAASTSAEVDEVFADWVKYGSK